MMIYFLYQNVNLRMTALKPAPPGGVVTLATAQASASVALPELSLQLPMQGEAARPFPLVASPHRRTAILCPAVVFHLQPVLVTTQPRQWSAVAATPTPAPPAVMPEMLLLVMDNKVIPENLTIPQCIRIRTHQPSKMQLIG